MKKYDVTLEGYYGRFGGAFIPEVLYANVENLRRAYLREMADPGFQQEFESLLRDYVGTVVKRIKLYNELIANVI